MKVLYFTSTGNSLYVARQFTDEPMSIAVSNLFVEYPDGNIDVEAEQKYPIIALANRCGMKWDGYVYTGGVMAAFADEEQLKQLAAACKDHAKRLTDKINEK